MTWYQSYTLFILDRNHYYSNIISYSNIMRLYSNIFYTTQDRTNVSERKKERPISVEGTVFSKIPFRIHYSLTSEGSVRLLEPSSRRSRSFQKSTDIAMSNYFWSTLRNSILLDRLNEGLRSKSL